MQPAKDDPALREELDCAVINAMAGKIPNNVLEEDPKRLTHVV